VTTDGRNDPETQRRERFLIAQPEDLDQEFVYVKESHLVEIVKAELQMGRRCCHVYAVYTRKRDVTRRLESILTREGIRVAFLTSDVAGSPAALPAIAGRLLLTFRFGKK
jgi:hypothetical protein